MMEEVQVKHSKSQAEWQLRFFDLSIERRLRLRYTQRLLGSTLGQSCLLISDDPGLHWNLRELGGSWHGAVSNTTVEDWLLGLGLDDITRLEGQVLPFDDGLFDKVIVLDGLDMGGGQQNFVEECHRVLKNAGRLIIGVPQKKLFALANVFGRLVQEEDAARPALSYSEQELFALLKDGFDVEETFSFARFFLNFTELTGSTVAAFMVQRDESGAITEVAARRIVWFLIAARPVIWLANKLDVLLFFTRGYTLMVRARRRLWRKRNISARGSLSLAEATLGGKIGTAVQP